MLAQERFEKPLVVQIDARYTRHLELSEESLRGAGTLNRSSSMADRTSDRFGILSIILQLIQGATESPPGGPGLVFPAGDLPSLVYDDARGLGRLFPRPGVGG